MSLSARIEIPPMDSHNQQLVGNTHPPDWVNPEPAKRYNLVVIGAGTAGLVSAAGAAGLGARVALVEKHLLGGDCLNVGCVPSKCLIRSSRVQADVRDAGPFGVTLSATPEVDFPTVMERMRRLRAGISKHDSAQRFQKMGVDVFLGEGQFSAPNVVTVAGKELRFSKAVIATGGRAAAPPIEGLSESGYLTNETVFSLTELPRRLAVIGGGPIGAEMAQAFRRFGSEVYLFHDEPYILSREDRDAAELVQKSFEADGVHLFLDSPVWQVERQGAEKVVRAGNQGNSREAVVDQILVGVDRAPHVQGLNLEAAGVKYDKRLGVQVDDRLRTSNKRIYAAGDISFRYKFTHTADALARIVIQNALFLGRRKASALTVPWCTYTDPELAHVGLSESEASDHGIAYDTFVTHFSEVDRAVADSEEDGFIKVLVRKGSDKILGATIVARHAGDMISEITLAMVGGLGLKTLSQVIHPYPTQAEAIKKVADSYSRTRLTPGVKRLFSRWLSWTR